MKKYIFIAISCLQCSILSAQSPNLQKLVRWWSGSFVPDTSIVRQTFSSFTETSVADSSWNISGNTTITGSNFIGTIGNTNFPFRTNNTQRMFIQNDGKIGINTSSFTPFRIAGIGLTSAQFQGNGIFQLDSFLSVGSAVDTLASYLTINHKRNGYDFLSIKNNLLGTHFGWQEEGGIGLFLQGYGTGEIDASFYIGSQPTPYANGIHIKQALPITLSGSVGNLIQADIGWLNLKGANAIGDISSVVNADLRIVGDLSNGTSGKGVYIKAYNGGSWRDGIKYLNVGSGEPDVCLVPDFGSVGIGNSSPSSNKLSVVDNNPGGGSQTSANFTMSNNTVSADNTNVKFVMSTTNSDDNVNIEVIASGGDDLRAGYFDAQGATTGTAIVAIAQGNGTNNALVTLAGNVGINTATPTELFQVAGSTYTTSITSEGKFGVGITPTAQAHFSAGTTTSNSGAIKFSEGVNPTTPEDGLVNYVSNNLTFTETSTVYTLLKALVGSATLDFPSTAAGTYSDLTITVTGANVGDIVSVGSGASPGNANTVFWGFVSSSNTVTVRFNNAELVASVDPGSATFKVSVIQ